MITLIPRDNIHADKVEYNADYIASYRARQGKRPSV